VFIVRASTPANIQKVPEAEQVLEDWQAAVEVYS
jgi:hypothetical protein